MNTRSMFNSFMLSSVVVITSVGLGDTIFKSEAEKPIHKRTMTPSVQSAKSEWLRSWHSNEVYSTRAEYTFDAFMTLKSSDEAIWFVRWILDKNRPIERGHVEGKAFTITSVSFEQPLLRLIRIYDYVDAKAYWSGEIAPESKLIRDAIKTAVKTDLLGRENRHNAFNILKIWIPTSAVTTELIETGTEYSIDWLERNCGKFTKDGVFAMTQDGILAKAIDAGERQKMLGYAAELSESFNGKTIAVAYNGRHNSKFREIQNIPLDGVNPSASIESFDRCMDKGVMPDEKIQGILTRESFSLTKEIWDGAVRRLGDIWTVDASIFNSFLHPDLKGAFTGVVVVKYEEDQIGDDCYYSDQPDETGKPKKYDVRKLVVLPSGVINGINVSSDFAYDESRVGGKFKAKYDSRSECYILMDMKSGHVVHSKIEAKAKDIEHLPSIALLEGCKANGNGSLIINFHGEVVNANP